MKKIISVCLLLTALISTMMCVQAVNAAVAFTADSSFAVGGTATVDFQKTAVNVMDDGSVTSDMYNAALEQNMSVTWKCSNGPDKTGKTVTWTEEDEGREYVCRVAFFSDDACTEFIDYIDSEVFTVTGGQPAVTAEITPDGPLYFFKDIPCNYQLKCNVSGVVFEPLRTSLPNGLEISKDGLISGTPTKEGFWFVTIAVYKDGEMVGDKGYEIYIQLVTDGNEYENPEITTKTLPEATVGQDYYVKLECTDPDAVFGEWYDAGKPNDLAATGLVLTQHGELEGKPAKAGTYTFTLFVSGETGEGYMTYTLTVNEEAQTPDDPQTDPDDAGDSTDDPVDTDPTVPAASNDAGKQNDDGQDDIWIYVCAGLGALLLAAIVVIVILVVSKKKAAK